MNVNERKPGLTQKAKRGEKVVRAMLVYALTALWLACLATRSSPLAAGECCSLPSLAQLVGGP